MKITKNLDNSTDEGWSIQVYSGDRRLLYTLEPAHMWMFFTGLAIGMLIAIFGFRFEESPPTPRLIDPEASSAPLAVD